MGSDISSIFIDWDGTLCATQLWHQWATGTEKEQAAHALIQKHLFTGPNDLTDQWLHGHKAAEDIAAFLSQPLSMPAKIILEELEQGCRTMQFIDPSLSVLLQQLRQQGKRVIISTDNMDCFTRWTVPALNLRDLVDDILTSAEQGVMKFAIDKTGQNIFFQHYFDQHQLKPESSVVIDDSLKGEAALRGLGLSYLQIRPGFSAADALQSLLKV